MQIHVTHFPLHPSVPPEGLLYTQLFAGRGFDIPTMMRQMQARMAAEGLVYKLPRDRTFNTGRAQQLSIWARENGHPSLDDALFRAVFSEGRNVYELPVLLDLVAADGLPVDDARAALEEGRHAAQVQADHSRARALGVTGVPTYVVEEPGTGRLRGVVGAQPYEVLVQLAKAAGAQPRG